ncbi:hypothetical protein M8C21_011001 [Ambrosia artemisiifolia]|uniref:Uncharacterized protein n=1 Tax=Ambrosia artemisiifolia TaxID=4212 RepID=A0AAD5BNY9_AMBAR|nr:hypothetical protein M8C21_011001 [Ambrosia artemisiifolia]
MKTIVVPTRRRFVDIRDELTLMWFTSFCRPCELDRRTCGLKDYAETICFGYSDHGMSWIMTKIRLLT